MTREKEGPSHGQRKQKQALWGRGRGLADAIKASGAIVSVEPATSR